MFVAETLLNTTLEVIVYITTSKSRLLEVTYI